jgi:hypothetical protein
MRNEKIKTKDWTSRVRFGRFFKRALDRASRRSKTIRDISFFFKVYSSFIVLFGNGDLYALDAILFPGFFVIGRVKQSKSRDISSFSQRLLYNEMGINNQLKQNK